MVKIQINSLQALERLIGDDREMSITVKESIINEFAKSHLKAVVNNEFLKNLKDEIIAYMKKTNYLGILDTQPTGRFGQREYVLSEDTKKMIQRTVRQEIDDIVRDAVEPIRQEIVEDIRSRADLAAESIIKTLNASTVEKLVNKRIEEMYSQVKSGTSTSVD